MNAERKTYIFMLVRAAVVAALYFVLTFSVAPIAFGPIQFRVGEALTLLPLLFPEAVIGLTVGCFLANLFSPFAWYDVAFGTAATLIAALLTLLIGRLMRGKKLSLRGLAGAVPPILVNALVLPLIWLYFGDIVRTLYFVNFATIFVTQTGVILILGIPLILGIERAGISIAGQKKKADIDKNEEKTP